ncbi:MAG: histidine phosphatase family protein, partial [Lachnospiraceae bacterium]|nr:histidine phosphatase family protein [Lachnospiraceae bacterium]
MRLLFIRHGEPDILNDTITETGRREAELLAERIAKTDITEFFVSTKGRALATAAPSLRLTKRSAAECDWLRELEVPVKRPDLNGGDSFIPWDWLPADWLSDTRFLDPVKWRDVPIFKEAGVGEAYDSAVSGFDAVLADHGYVRDGLLYRAERPNCDTLAFFCHFGITCVFLSHLMNCSPMMLWHGLCMAPSSVTTVYTEERRPGIASFRA